MKIKKICSYFGYSRQAYYKSRRLEKTKSQSEVYEYILGRRKDLALEGIRKLYIHLHRDKDFRISRSALTELLLQNGLIICRKKRYRVLTDSSHKNTISENLLRRNYPEHVFEVLVSDITYLRTREKEYYLTAIMDLYARMIISYCLTNHLGTEGLIRAFMLIVKEYKSKLKGCIFHSDRGTQFCSNSFKELTEKYGMISSNSRNGNPYDNACMERVFATLKNEYMLKITFPDLESLNKALKDAVYSYNNQRLHMSLQNKTPKQIFVADLKSY